MLILYVCVVHKYSSHIFHIMVHCQGIPFFLFVDSCLSFCLCSFWSLCCLSFFDLRILIPTLVSSSLSFISAIVKTSTCVKYESHSWLFKLIIFGSIFISWNSTSVDESFLMLLLSLSFNCRSWGVVGNIIRISLLCLSVIGKDQMSCYATLLMINDWIDPASSQIIN